MKTALVALAAFGLALSGCSTDLDADQLVGTWSGSIEVPKGSSCIESCERSITFREDHAFETSDACPGWLGTWKVADENVIELMPTSHGLLDEDGSGSCLSGSSFKPRRVKFNDGVLKVHLDDDDTSVELTKSASS